MRESAELRAEQLEARVLELEAELEAAAGALNVAADVLSKMEFDNTAEACSATAARAIKLLRRDA